MSASLVGSEMCIRDRVPLAPGFGCITNFAGVRTQPFAWTGLSLPAPRAPGDLPPLSASAQHSLQAAHTPVSAHSLFGPGGTYGHGFRCPGHPVHVAPFCHTGYHAAAPSGAAVLA
eukprot:15472121-Alexandrium_andersonii.AAC.1